MMNPYASKANVVEHGQSFGTKKHAKPIKGKGPTHDPIHGPKKTIVKSKANVKFEGKCFNCDKYGHWFADFRAKKRDRP